MARKSKAKKSPAKKAKKGAAPKGRVSKVIDQVKEPLSLLNTLKAEGLNNAMMMLTLAGGIASEAKKNLRLENVKPQLKELVYSLGFAFREDMERLEARIEELEQSLSEKEYKKLTRGEDE